MRISDWSSDVCSSDLGGDEDGEGEPDPALRCHQMWVAGGVTAVMIVRTTRTTRTTGNAIIATGRRRHHRFGFRSTNGTAISSPNRTPEPNRNALSPKRF